MDIRELTERQQWTLAQKIDHSLGVIDQFASHFDNQVYVSFSGGKDSCVMLSLVEMIVPNVHCVFIMTGCESPSVCRFVRHMRDVGHNIEFVKPKKTLQKVFAEHGFPLVSKEVSHDVQAVRRNPYCMSSRNKLRRDNKHCIPERWMYLINEPYEVSDRCCFWLKKHPAHEYEQRTGRKPYIGTLAAESNARTTAYIHRGGCNSFGDGAGQRAVSMPLSIWTDDDVWKYIKDRRLEIPDIYQKGAKRTGCMGCGFGLAFDRERLELMRELWPKWYDMVMSYKNNGIRYDEAIAVMYAKLNK